MNQPAITEMADDLAAVTNQIADIANYVASLVSQGDGDGDSAALLLGCAEERRSEFETLWSSLRRSLDEAGADWRRAPIRRP